MMAVKTQPVAPQKLAATKGRSFRTFLLMQQFAAQEIGERIRLARKERGLTQEQLAVMAGFSKRSLQDYECGVTIPYRHFRELAKLLRRDEMWFLYGETEDASSRREGEQAILRRLGEVEQQLVELDARYARTEEVLERLVARDGPSSAKSS